MKNTNYQKIIIIRIFIVKLIYTSFYPRQRNRLKFTLSSIYYGKCVKLLFNQKIIVLMPTAW